MRRFCIAFILCSIALFGNSQSNRDVQKTLLGLADRYHNNPNFQFKIRFTNWLELPNGAEQGKVSETGEYAVAGTKAFYRLGQVEAIINDSIFVAVYKDDRLIISSRPSAKNLANFFPMQGALDSLLRLSQSRYQISLKTDNNSDTGEMRFSAIQASETVKEFQLIFHRRNNLISSVRYTYNAGDPDLPKASENGDLNKHAKRVMLIEFFDYTTGIVDETLFDEKKYVIAEGAEYRPVAAFDDFRIFSSKPSDLINR